MRDYLVDGLADLKGSLREKDGLKILMVTIFLNLLGLKILMVYHNSK